MATTSLLDLISRADTFDPSTAWLLKHLNRNLPATAFVLKAKAEVIAEPIPEFRKVPGGLIKIGEHIVGNAHGNGYLDGRVGRWPELKAEVFETLLGKDVALPPVGKPLAEKTSAKASTPKPIKTKAFAKNVGNNSDDYLVCEECGKRVSYEEGLVRVGGKRICGKCAHKRHAHVAV